MAVRYRFAPSAVFVLFIIEEEGNMLRKIVLVLMMWGLIAQPLMASVLDFMPADSSSSVVVDSDITTTTHHAVSTEETSASPCHEIADKAKAPATMDCADCDGGCASQVCTSSCSLSSPAVINQSLPMHACHTLDRVVAANDALVQGIRPRIYHPPKHV